MAYEKTIPSPQNPRSSYETALQCLAQSGFIIMRKRELAWLVQANKDVEGKSRVVNITCRPGAQTQVTVSCLTTGKQPDEVERALIDSLVQRLAQLLNQD